MSWHALTENDVLEKLESTDSGITMDEAQRRLEKYGYNELHKDESGSTLRLLLRQLSNYLVILLFIASLVSFLAGKTFDSIVILSVIILNTIVGFVQEYRAEKALEAIKSLSSPESKVLRDCPDFGGCIATRIKARSIVPGDLLIIETGDRVPADARIIEALNLEVDESMLTGESTPVRKSSEKLPIETSVADRVNMLFSGTLLTHGRGRAVIVETGMDTEIGKIAGLIEESGEVITPIQMDLNRLTRSLGGLAVISSFLTIIIGVLRGYSLLEMFLISLATLVSAIPEGLPAVLTVTMAVGVNRMAKRKAIIRKLQAVDTLGTAEVIVTDKTGTLTLNQMTVREIVTPDGIYNIDGIGYEPKGDIIKDGKIVKASDHPALDLLLRTSSLCNDAKLVRDEIEKETTWKIFGDPTEAALIVAANKGGLEPSEFDSKYKRVNEIPFDPKRRFMATLDMEKQDNFLINLKGAPETVLSLSSHYCISDKCLVIDEKLEEMILNQAEKLAHKAYRVLGIAYLEGGSSIHEIFNGLESGDRTLIFVGLVGMIDPPRDEVVESIEICKAAGLRVIMATGDHKTTAEAIAKEVGILNDGLVFTGEELDMMDDYEIDNSIDKISVFARTSPSQKYRVIESLRRQDHVVAMTGDGVNDAPALKIADIGIAMGITGTDVTKETADMILADDNFATIVNAIEEGRLVFENITKVVKFLVTTNVGEIIALIGALILFPRAPIIVTPIQILWVNLVTDGLLTIPLALEPMEEGYMNQPPRPRHKPIIDKEIMESIGYVSTIMAAGILYLYSNKLNTSSVFQAQNIAFISLAMYQVFNAHNCRSRLESIFSKGFLTNRYMILSTIVSVLLLYLSTINPFLQRFLGTMQLSMTDWVRVISFSSLAFILQEVRKYFKRI
ncbi:HAD-IC family P-type ATPase [Candidatus Bathyarchaeota archaeon]|nr:HAD-IC family P-type ATPase [Candidatus Bathyarchaeota archaeon]